MKRYAARMISKLGGNGKDVSTELQPIIEHQVCSFKSPTHSRSSSFQVTEGGIAEEIMTVTTTESKDKPLSSFSIENPTTTNSNIDCPTIVIVSQNAPDKSHTSNSDTVVSTNTTTNNQVAETTEAQTATTKNFHEMSYDELLLHLREMRMQKRNVRSVLRTFENDFYKKTGRRVEKEDRCNMSSVYHCYKVLFFFVFHKITSFNFYFYLQNTKGKIRLLEALVAKMQREQAEPLNNG